MIQIGPLSLLTLDPFPCQDLGTNAALAVKDGLVFVPSAAVVMRGLAEREVLSAFFHFAQDLDNKTKRKFP